MLPLRDNVPTRTTPVVNYALIAANAAVFFHELSLGRGLERFIDRYGLVPGHYASLALAHRAGWQAFLAPFITSMFLHAGWLHILSNMWCLWIFGDNVEDAMGHARYLLFYLICGLAAAATQLWASWHSPYPTLGASGAIAGVMGAFLLLYPRARVLTLVPIFIFVRLIEVPATLFLGLWILTQFYSGTLSLHHTGPLGGVAWWAHIGGFMTGIILLGAFVPDSGAKRRR